MRKIIISRFKNLKIVTKIIVCYLVIAVISISTSAFMYQRADEKIMTKKVSEMALQTLQMIDANLSLLIYTVNNESKFLLANQRLQDTLAHGSEGFNYNNQLAISRYLNEFIQSNMFISSVYIFDNNGNKYYVDKGRFKSFNLNHIKSSKWYDEMKDANGSYIVKLTGKELYNLQDERYVSIIRTVNDLDTQEPIGTMIINIPEVAIINSFKDIMKNGDAIIQLKDDYNNDIIHTKDLAQYNIHEDYDEIKEGEHLYSIKKIKTKEYIISYLKNNLNWTIISIVPYEELSNQSSIYMITVLIMLLLSGTLVSAGIIITSWGITRPINKLIESMKGVENGEFKKVDMDAGNNEIGKLNNIYNAMIFKIENLIKEILREQKIKRKAELDVLQSQIKPHFLYNSFDAISSLALNNRNEDVYEIIKALGNFYRTSLSQGREVVSIEEEIRTAKSYATIMQMRYNNLFTIEMDIDEQVKKYNILKLVLQPLVENSIYHGIKPTKRDGRIFIRASLKGEYIELMVSDNGAGMSQEQFNSVIKGETSGIGLRGTMERLNIYYNKKCKFKIESLLDQGTKVTIHIPIEMEDNHGE